MYYELALSIHRIQDIHSTSTCMSVCLRVHSSKLVLCDTFFELIEDQREFRTLGLTQNLIVHAVDSTAGISVISNMQFVAKQVLAILSNRRTLLNPFTPCGILDLRRR